MTYGKLHHGEVMRFSFCPNHRASELLKQDMSCGELLVAVLQGMGWEMCAVISSFALNTSRKGSRHFPLPPSETQCLKDLPES